MSKVSWKQQLAQKPELWDINNWQLFNPLELTSVKLRLGYQKNCRIISHYLSCHDVALVATTQGCSSKRVYQLLDRSLSSNDHCPEPMLARGLIPHYRSKIYHRRSAISSLSHDAGDSGSMRYVFEKIPKVKSQLEKLIKGDLKDKPHALNVTPKLFMQMFHELLEEHDWPRDQWPWNRERLGQETLRKLYHQMVNKFRSNKINANPVLLPSSRYVYRELQLDECTVDLHSSVYINFGDEVLPFRLSRFSLIVLSDRDTQLIVSWLIVLNKHPVKTDILEVLRGIKHPRVPSVETLPDLIQIDPAGIIPESLHEQLASLQVGLVSMDNALTHLSHCVRDFVCNELKATYHLGRPKVPVAREMIEKVFNNLNVDFTHLSKSTAGSSPVDPKKESANNAKKPPVVSVAHLEDWFASFVALQNSRRKDNLRGLTPIERCQFLLKNTWHFHDFAEPRLSTNLHYLEYSANIKVSQNGSFNPRINIFSLTYTAKMLTTPLEKNWDNIQVQVYSKDLRVIKAFSQGKFIGEFWAPSDWQDYPFDLRTRRFIRKLVRTERIAEKHPLMGYFMFLLDRLNIPTYALEFYRVSQVITDNYGLEVERKIQRALKQHQPRNKSTHLRSKSHVNRSHRTSRLSQAIKEKMNECHDQ